MKNVFEVEKNKNILAFIDIDAHLSGDLMKNIEFRRPSIIQELKDYIAKNGNFIGNVIDIRGFTFLTIRKHYNSKIDVKQIGNLLSNLNPNQIYKTTPESYGEIASFILDNFNLFPNIELYETSAWGTWKKEKIKK